MRVPLLRLAPSLLLLLAAAPAAAQVPTQIKGRMMVLVDTSGSMAWHFDADTVTGGDGDLNSRYRDVTFTTPQRFYPGTILGNGTPDGSNSRLYAAKQALTNLVNATGDVDFGLMRYAPSQYCPNGNTCCDPTKGACFCGVYGYIDNAKSNCGLSGNRACCVFQQTGNVNWGEITWAGDCGPSSGGIATNGGQILVNPSPSSAPNLLTWVDGQEDFRNDTNGNVINPELRAAGSTPLAGAMRTALNSWYQPIVTYSHANPNCDPTSNPNCDPKVDCRPYVFVVMTDGADDCEGCNANNSPGGDPRNGCNANASQLNNPPAIAQMLHAANPNNPLQVYVIGLAFQTGGACKVDTDCGTTGLTCQNGTCKDPAIPVLNNMAVSGGTKYARFANSQAQIEAALADISASTVKYEICNGVDDNCNGLIDEGLGVYQECSAGTQCTSGACNAGRCTCAKDADCKSGFVCGGGLCVPGCSTGIGACLRTGVTKCSSGGTGCCVNDGQSACTPLMAGAPMPEVCNGIDDDCNGIIDDGNVCQKCAPQPETCNGLDDDCNGKIDDNLTDVGKTCGTTIGICTAGTTACVPNTGKVFPDASDHLVCQGAVMPTTPMCNGCDNDCDGVVDQPTVACYDGPAGTANVGICLPGTKKCTLTQCNPNQPPQYSTCVGEVLPKTEVCNGIDDDCNGKIDDVPGSNVSCCPSGKCGVGQCAAGTMQCSGGVLACTGAVGPSVEVCDGIDNDCNGKVDDVPGVGNPCQPQGACGAGTLVCDVASKSLVCKSSGGMAQPEICNGIDDDCDGVIDEPDQVAKNDPRVGMACGPGLGKPAPCMPGMTVCKNGGIVCQGGVGPMPEVCDGMDNNCDGTVDNGAMCPTGYDCYMGGCYQHCQPANEFDTGCPGGYACDKNMYCLPNGCAGGCGQCQVCQGGACTDLCATKSCPATYKCDCGNCVDDSCVSKGCPSGQVCDVAARMCKADPCQGVHCSANQFCDPGSGMCVGSCAGVSCPSGQTCVMGNCTQDKCAGRSCPEGQSCDASTGACVGDPCATVTCEQAGFTCVKGMCVQDPCNLTHCPSGATCKTNPLDGSVSCASAPSQPKDLVVGGGGGGVGCSVGAGVATGEGGSPSALALVLLALVGLARRRGRRRDGRAGEVA